MFVRISTTKFEESAGKIWKALYENNNLKKNKLLKITDLNEKELHSGIGWLARENKIVKEKNCNYRLDTTNLTPEIGSMAGKIWKILDIWGEVDINSIKKLSGADETEIYSALGWLAREDKINEMEDQVYSLK
jgi:hypothetical protein